MTQPRATGLLGEVQGLLEQAVVVFGATPQEHVLRDVLQRLDEPLRVAIAGKVKAGKSTLLNALVGEELAPTDAGECTQIVTWYRNGHTYRVLVEPSDGAPRQARFHRDEGAIEVDLDGLGAGDVERITIDWPSRSLERITLIDTPGIASMSESVSARSHAFLTPSEDRITDADAVLYLMKHLHASDADFLESFHDEEVSQATPVNAIAILSRADEVGCGRLDSMESAARIAERYRSDGKVRRLVQTVLPVAGLLAETGATLREAEFRALGELAGSPDGELELLLLSVDRFVEGPSSTSLTSDDREVLLERLGLFGIRLSVELIRDGAVTTSSRLATTLIDRSGLRELRAALLSQFADRRDVLKARAGLLAVDTAIRARPDLDTGGLSEQIERISAGAHEINELRLLNMLRAGSTEVKPGDVADMERLLGTFGTSAAERLGLVPGADRASIAASAGEQLAKWQRKAESPMSNPDVVAASRVVIRTCEGILADVTTAPPP